MPRRMNFSLALIVGALALFLFLGFGPMTKQDSGQAPSRLAVLWTSSDPEVATKVAFMYTLAAKKQGWFDEVTLIVWGPSAKLLSENQDLQTAVTEMAGVGVQVVACKACADSYDASDTLEGLGIDVKYMGQPLTEILKGDWEVITF